jgi:hypothetical protein
LIDKGIEVRPLRGPTYGGTAQCTLSRPSDRRVAHCALAEAGFGNNQVTELISSVATLTRSLLVLLLGHIQRIAMHKHVNNDQDLGRCSPQYSYVTVRISVRRLAAIPPLQSSTKCQTWRGLSVEGWVDYNEQQIAIFSLGK